MLLRDMRKCTLVVLFFNSSVDFIQNPHVIQVTIELASARVTLKTIDCDCYLIQMQRIFSENIIYFDDDDDDDDDDIVLY